MNGNGCKRDQRHTRETKTKNTKRKYLLHSQGYKAEQEKRPYTYIYIYTNNIHTNTKIKKNTIY
tara:strand:+ start:79 stop:270 length:192 start_codon:yes stop_codon:yes gene_type:complete